MAEASSPSLHATPAEPRSAWRLAPSVWALIAFAISATFAVTENWSLAAFCWSTWLAGLLYAWTCTATGAVQIILTARSRKPEYELRFPFLRAISPQALLVLIVAIAVTIALAAAYAYTWVFGFYGLFLSFFAEMQPHTLFGRNGFINSDFFTPVSYLIVLFWPMAVGALIANWHSLLGNDPWQRILLPAQTEIVRIHFLIVLMPFLALLAWAVVGDAYNSVTVVMLMGLFYLLPRKSGERQVSVEKGKG